MSTESQQDLVVSPRVVVPSAEFEWAFARSSGPGGQNVNKVNSKALLRWRPLESAALGDDMRQRFLTRFASRLTTAGELLIESEEFRDQPQNIRRCLEKLRLMLTTIVHPPRPRKATKRTAGSHRRRLAEKKQRSETKQRRRPPAAD